MKNMTDEPHTLAASSGEQDQILRQLLILAGPTASGKSATALRLAEQLNAEIVSVDSMAVYRGMDIGTAKPTRAEREQIPHHLIDIHEPWEQMTVAGWRRAALTAIADIRQRGKEALVVGGTPLYLKALLRGLFAAPPVDMSLRQRLESLSSSQLWERLTAADPLTAKRLHPTDRRRQIRALEIFEQTGQSITLLQRQFDRPACLARPGIWLDWPRSQLHSRIHTRLDQMLSADWLGECRRLAALPRALCREARQAAGYRELFEVVAGMKSVPEVLPIIQTRTRQLAKRQITWLRHFDEVQPLAVSSAQRPEDIVEEVLQIWTR